MLSVFKEKASPVVSFIGNFVRDETSQVTKTTVMRIGSVLAVLAVAAMPQTAAALDPCGGEKCAGANCDYNQCSYVRQCAYEPCELHKMPCTGGSWGYAKWCMGTEWICGSCD